jgi:hypothetical protein
MHTAVSVAGKASRREFAISLPSTANISLSRIVMLAKDERFVPPVQFHIFSKPPATQNLSQNTDGSAFAR